MADEQTQVPGIAVPKVALRICQVLVGGMVLSLVLAVSVAWMIDLGELIHIDDPKHELTMFTVGFACFSLVYRFLAVEPMCRGFAWCLTFFRSSEISRWKTGVHYFFGVMLSANCYYFPAWLCWIFYFLEPDPINAVLGTILTALILVEFPTHARAERWVQRYFQRPVVRSPE